MTRGIALFGRASGVPPRMGAVALLSLVLVLGVAGCGDAPAGGGGHDPGPSTVSEASVTTSTTSATSGSTATGPTACEENAAMPYPEGVPATWKEWQDWTCEARLFVPSSEDDLPPPIHWEPCVDPPASMSCESIALDWGENASIGIGGLWSRDAVPVLWYKQASHGREGKLSTKIITDVDGPAHTALSVYNFVYTNDPPVWVNTFSLEEGRYLYDGWLASDEPQGAPYSWLSGTWDQLTPTIVSQSDSAAPSVGGAKWILSKRSDGVHMMRVDGTDDRWVGPFEASGAAFFGDRVLFSAAGQAGHGIYLWQPDAPLRTMFFRSYSQPMYDIAKLVADEDDVVFLLSDGSWKDDKTEIMHTKMTFDAAAFQPQPIARKPYWSAVPNIRLGCGYVMVNLTDTAIIRLSDGWTWTMLGEDRFKNQGILGVTCDEAFNLVTIDHHTTIARVRLDSLGEGYPTDVNPWTTQHPPP